jgi:hypothetical protein
MYVERLAARLKAGLKTEALPYDDGRSGPSDHSRVTYDGSTKPSDYSTGSEPHRTWHLHHGLDNMLNLLALRKTTSFVRCPGPAAAVRE